MIILPALPPPDSILYSDPSEQKNEARNVCGRSGLRFFIK